MELTSTISPPIPSPIFEGTSSAYPGLRGEFTLSFVIDDNDAHFFESKNGSIIHSVSYQMPNEEERARELILQFYANTDFENYLRGLGFMLCDSKNTRDDIPTNSADNQMLELYNFASGSKLIQTDHPEQMVKLFNIIMENNDFPEKYEKEFRADLEEAAHIN